MSDPGLSGTSVRKRIGARNTVVLGDVLSGLKVPPNVRIGDVACSHGEQAEEENHEKDELRTKQPLHRITQELAIRNTGYTLLPRTWPGHRGKRLNRSSIVHVRVRIKQLKANTTANGSSGL